MPNGNGNTTAGTLAPDSSLAPALPAGGIYLDSGSLWILGIFGAVMLIFGQKLADIAITRLFGEWKKPKTVDEEAEERRHHPPPPTAAEIAKEITKSLSREDEEKGDKDDGRICNLCRAFLTKRIDGVEEWLKGVEGKHEVHVQATHEEFKALRAELTGKLDTVLAEIRKRP